MKHLMADIYSVGTDTTDPVKINEIINEIITKLSLTAVMPNINLPYYYCEPAEDGGVTSFCILDNGHITVHTFPFYGNCYIDIMFSEIDEASAKALFGKLFQTEKIDMQCIDRDNEFSNYGYHAETDFGPHLLVNAKSDKIFTMDEIYTILESLPRKIGMHAITRPFVIKNRMVNPSVISGIVIIAESHISFHQSIDTGKIHFDIYSCKFRDTSVFTRIPHELFGDKCTFQLISRGKKLTDAVKPGYSLTNNGWRNNV